MEGYYASIRPDSFLIRKTIGSGPGHSGWKWLPFTMSSNNCGTHGNECPYTYRGTGSPLNRSTLKGAGDMAQTVKYCVTGTSPEFKPKYSQKKKIYLGLRTSLSGRMSAQHVQGPGFNSPTLLNFKKNGKKKISGINVT
jgi:hypothetical protein